MLSFFRVVLALGAAGALAAQTGCASIAIATAPTKTAARDESEAAQAGERAFWSALHSGSYAAIEPALESLQRAFVVHPNDARIAAHIAFLHIWRVSERSRAPERATVTEDMLLARRYFDEAVALDSHDPRYAGFRAATLMGEGSILHDEKVTRRGFFAMGDAVDAWPEFNLFTRGYVMSQLPHTDSKFADALEDQWRTLDLCAGADAKVDRKRPDFAPVMPRETREGRTRVCWNSWAAPHNFEGFFMNMGDMLVKAGEVDVAQRIYEQTKLSKQYATWPYRDVLERRITQAADNVSRFRAPAKDEAEQVPMIASKFSCTGCHQE